MGYRIEYSAGQTDIIRCRERGKRDRWPFVLAVLLLLALIGPVRERVVGMLIPGEDEVTVRAFRDMVDSLREGDSVGEALEVFCREVIYETA